jgi:preprotein translocase subunit SecG
MIFNLIMVIQVLSALIIVGLVLMQHGKGADMGAAFGSGASGSLFGASGSSNFLSKSTGVAAAVFFAATLALTYLAPGRNQADVTDALPTAAPAASAPATPAASAPAVPAATPAAVPAPAASAATPPVAPAAAPVAVPVAPAKAAASQAASGK